MAASTRFTTIPANFRFILPVVSAVTGVVVYASVYVYQIPSICFILAIVGAGLQFLLGIYCCILGAKVGHYHRYIVPLWLLVLAGLWAAPLYYFVIALIASLQLQNLVKLDKTATDQLTWRAVGLGCSALNVILNLILLLIFLVKGSKRTAFATQQQTRSSTVYHTVAQQPAQTHAQAYHYPPQAAAPAQEYKPARTYTTLSSAPSTVSPAPYTYPASPPPPSLPAASELQSQPVALASELPSPQAQAPYVDRTNRIEVLRRLGQLQFADGHWEYSQELYGLMSAWGGNVGDGTPRGVTTGVAGVVMGIVEGVWALQREGREGALSAGERESLGGMGWDLGWARGGAENGRAWVGRYAM